MNDNWKLASPADKQKNCQESFTFIINFPAKFKGRIESELRVMLRNIEIEILDDEDDFVWLKVSGDYHFEQSGYYEDGDGWECFYSDVYYAFKDIYKEIEIQRP